MSVQFITTKVHGVLDYVVVVVLVFAPMIFGFQELGGPAVVIPVVLGVGIFIYSFLTRYEWGVFKVISMPYHLALILWPRFSWQFRHFCSVLPTKH